MTQPGAGAGLEAAQVRSDVRPHRGGLRRDEHAHDRRVAPPLARARRRLARVGPGSRVLDVATGTGDLAFELARRVTPGGEVVGSDFSEAMLARARAGRKAAAARERRFEWADALALPYADDYLRRRDGRLRRAQLLRSRTRPRRAGTRRATRRAAWWSWSSPADARTAVALLPLLVRPRRAGSAAARSRRARTADGAATTLPAELGRPLSGAGGAGRELRARRLGAIRYLLTAGGIIALHAGTVQVDDA